MAVHVIGITDKQLQEVLSYTEDAEEARAFATYLSSRGRLPLSL
jgi:hypothetical protein